MKQNKVLLIFFVLVILLTIYSLTIPFFWDSAFFSALSVHFYNVGYSGFLAPESLDTGGFPLYSAYLTLTWKLFGKSLVASHLALLPFLFGIVYEFYKLCKRYLNEKTIGWALLIFFVDPVFLTQSALMGYDIVILYFFLLSLNALQQNKNLLYSIAILLLCLISIRGMMLASALFLIDLIHSKKIDPGKIKNYAPTILVLSIWFISHKLRKGWFLFSPFRENDAEGFADIGMIFRQLMYVVWKNLDLGRATLWLIVLFFTGIYIKKEKTAHQKELFSLLFVPLIVLSCFMILIENPIGHKYFLVVNTMLVISACYFIQEIQFKGSRTFVYSLLIACLLAGNFIVYPQRYGNAWDSSLKILPYFKMESEMRNYIESKKIQGLGIATQFPLTIGTHATHLSENPVWFTDIENDDINRFPYFLYSNIINTGRMEDLEKVKQTWIPEKELKSGLIELTLYKNPRP